MKRKMRFIHGLLMLHCYLAFACEAAVQQKAEATTPIPTLSPPEGNTTFVGGTTWCIALAGVAQVDLQQALDWACGPGSTDCSAVQAGGPCFAPNTLLSHASYAFNSYYQQNGNSDIACNFGGTAAITKRDPSYGGCVYLSSEQASESSTPSSRNIWSGSGFYLLSYLSFMLYYLSY